MKVLLSLALVSGIGASACVTTKDASPPKDCSEYVESINSYEAARGYVMIGADAIPLPGYPSPILVAVFARQDAHIHVMAPSELTPMLERMVERGKFQVKGTCNFDGLEYTHLTRNASIQGETV